MQGFVAPVVFFSLIALCYCSRVTPFDYVNMNKLSMFPYLLVVIRDYLHKL